VGIGVGRTTCRAGVCEQERILGPPWTNRRIRDLEARGTANTGHVEHRLRSPRFARSKGSRLYLDSAEEPSRRTIYENISLQDAPKTDWNEPVRFDPTDFGQRGKRGVFQQNRINRHDPSSLDVVTLIFRVDPRT
jgi:hypothetical protein